MYFDTSIDKDSGGHSITMCNSISIYFCSNNKAYSEQNQTEKNKTKRGERNKYE